MKEQEIVDKFLADLIALRESQKREVEMRLLARLRTSRPRIEVVGTMVPLVTIILGTDS